MKFVAAGLMLGGLLFAQAPSTSTSHGATPPATAKKPATGTAKAPAKATDVSAWRAECSKTGGFCIQVPSTWKSLGEVFDGAGLVVAEPDAKKSQDDWNQITAAATDMPEAKNGEDRPSTDELIDIILGSPSSGIKAETLQRSRTLLAGMPTDVLKVRLRSKESTTDAVEFIALMDDGETIYSVAVGCAPEDATRLEPVFEHVLHSWKATTPTAAPNLPATPDAAPPPKL
jgi:hypothetical protein